MIQNDPTITYTGLTPVDVSNTFLDSIVILDCLPTTIVMATEIEVTTPTVTDDIDFLTKRVTMETAEDVTIETSPDVARASTSTCPTSPASSVTNSLTDDMEDEILTVIEDGLIDAELAQAAIAALDSGNLTPIIKEELRLAIQSKRLNEGKEELMSEQPKKRLTRKVSTTSLYIIFWPKRHQCPLPYFQRTTGVPYLHYCVS